MLGKRLTSLLSLPVVLLWVNPSAAFDISGFHEGIVIRAVSFTTSGPDFIKEGEPIGNDSPACLPETVSDEPLDSLYHSSEVPSAVISSPLSDNHTPGKNGGSSPGADIYTSEGSTGMAPCSDFLTDSPIAVSSEPVPNIPFKIELMFYENNNPIQVEDVLVNFQMKMPMGTFNFNPAYDASRGIYEINNIILPRCMSGDKTWYAVVQYTINKGKNKYEFSFKLQ